MSHIQEKVEEEEEEEEDKIISRSHDEYSRKNLSCVVPIMSNHDITTELTWENGQLSFNGLGQMLPNKQIYGGDTLESLVRQGYNTTFKSFPLQHHEQSNPNHQEGKLSCSDENKNTQVLFSAEKWIPNPSSNQQVEVDQSSMPTYSGGFDNKKRARLLHESEKSYYHEMKRYYHQHVADDDDQLAPEVSACASASAAFCREKDSTLMTWPSFESPQTLKTSRKGEDLDSACNDFSENQDGERMTTEETYLSHSSARRSRASAIHNLSERRRRDRINQKMKALQKLVPNASKTDKASMLDEVIQYLKQLQTQVQMMSNARNNMMINQQQQMMMMMPSTNNIQQQQFQMSLLSRMGMFDMARSMQANSSSLFMPSPFVIPPMNINPGLTNIPLKINNGNNSAGPSFNHAFNAFLAQQSMNADFFNKMATLYGQTANQLSKNQVNLSQSDINGHGQ